MEKLLLASYRVNIWFSLLLFYIIKNTRRENASKYMANNIYIYILICTSCKVLLGIYFCLSFFFLGKIVTRMIKLAHSCKMPIFNIYRATGRTSLAYTISVSVTTIHQKYVSAPVTTSCYFLFLISWFIQASKLSNKNIEVTNYFTRNLNSKQLINFTTLTSVAFVFINETDA